MKVSIMITGKNSGRKRRSGLKGRITAALCLGRLEFDDAGKEENSHKYADLVWRAVNFKGV